MAVLALPAGVKLTRNTVERDPATGDITYKLEYTYVVDGEVRPAAATTGKAAGAPLTAEGVVNTLLTQIYADTGTELPGP
jgi:hypothetical protein